MRDSILSIYMSFRADFFFEVVNSVTCGGQMVLCIKDFPKTSFVMRGTILYKPRKNIWGVEVGRKEEKGSNLENMFPEVSPCVEAGLFFGSASLPTPSYFLTLRAHLRKESLFI